MSKLKVLAYPRFEYYKVASGWRWRLKGSNQEVVAIGEKSYQNKSDCIVILEAIRTAVNAPTVEIEEVDYDLPDVTRDAVF